MKVGIGTQQDVGGQRHPSVVASGFGREFSYECQTVHFAHGVTVADPGAVPPLPVVHGVSDRGRHAANADVGQHRPHNCLESALMGSVSRSSAVRG